MILIQHFYYSLVSAKQCQQGGGIGIFSSCTLVEKIKLNNYPHTKVPLQELQIPGER